MDPKLYKEIHDRWERIGLLKGIADQNYAAQVAILMDSQMKFNEQQPGYTPFSSVFLRVSIPLARRVYGYIFGSNIISVQSCLGPATEITHRDKYGNLQNKMVASKSRRLKSGFDIPTGDYQYEIDRESELTLDLAEKLSKEIDEEICNDLLKVATVDLDHAWRGPAAFLDFLRISANKVYRGANWVVVPPAIFDEFKESEDFQADVKDIFANNPKAGRLFNKLDVYVLENLPADKVLFGFRGDFYDAGYFYCPYIPLQVLKIDEERNGLMTRYGKSLVNGDYYGKITIEGHSIQGGEDVLS